MVLPSPTTLTASEVVELPVCVTCALALTVRLPLLRNSIVL